MGRVKMIFLDASFIVSYYNTRDDNHEKAKEIMSNIANGLYGDAIISDYIFDESATIILYKLKDLSKTIKICKTLKELIGLNINEDIFEECWNIFINQKNNLFSFTDCSIIAAMRKNKIPYLATFDKEFEKINWIKVINHGQ